MFPKVVQVIPMKDYSVFVHFEDGKIVCYKFVAKTHRLDYGMKATGIFYLSFA